MPDAEVAPSSPPCCYRLLKASEAEKAPRIKITRFTEVCKFNGYVSESSQPLTGHVAKHFKHYTFKFSISLHLSC